MKSSKEIICGIYKITSPSGKIYIGMSPDIYRRWRGYKYEKGKRQPKLHASILKHGFDSHELEIVEVCSIDKLQEREIYYIKYYNSFNTAHGMNLTTGGIGSKGCRITDGNKKIIGDRNRGHIVSDEVRKRTSQTLKKLYENIPHHSKGKKQPQSLIDKRVAKNTGKKHSEETKIVMSKKAIGNKRWLGNHHSESSKEKIRTALKGKEKSIPSSPKLILNTETGIYYTVVREAANTINQRSNTLCRRLHGRLENNTSFIYV